MKLPKLRTKNLIEQNLKNETLIYDLNTNQAFNLNETSTIVYQACYNKLTFDELKRKHKFMDDFIYLALDELKSHNLLADDGPAYQSPFTGISRRDVIKKVGFASMFVLPIISGIIAPKAAQAASGFVDSSGGSNRPGFYNQECVVQYTASGFTQFCYGDLRCGFTKDLSNRCCKGGNPGAVYLLSGESIVDQDNSPRYYPASSPPTTGVNNCSSGSANCCDGSAPAGTCTIEPDTINEYGPEDYAGFEQTGYYPYIQTCTCSC